MAIHSTAISPSIDVTATTELGSGPVRIVAFLWDDIVVNADEDNGHALGYWVTAAGRWSGIFYVPASKIQPGPEPPA